MVIKNYPVLYKNKTIYVELPIGAKVLSIDVINIEKTDETESYIYAIINEKETRTIERELLWLGVDWTLSREEKLKIKNYQYLGSYKDGSHDVWHIWIEKEPNFVESYNEEFSKLLTKNFIKAIEAERKNIAC